jgi:penicillin-insensitive murein endopeptidase
MSKNEPLRLKENYERQQFVFNINLQQDPNNTTNAIMYKNLDHPHILYIKNNMTTYICSNRFLHDDKDSAIYKCTHVYRCELCDYNLCLECYYKLTEDSILQKFPDEIQMFRVVSKKIVSQSENFGSRDPLQKYKDMDYKNKYKLPDTITYDGETYKFYDLDKSMHNLSNYEDKKKYDANTPGYFCMRCSHSYTAPTPKFINENRNICIYCANDINKNSVINNKFLNLPDTINNSITKEEKKGIDHPHPLKLKRNKGYGHKCSSHNDHKSNETFLDYSKHFYECESCNYSLCLNCYKAIYQKDDKDFKYTKCTEAGLRPNYLVTYTEIKDIVFKGDICTLTIAQKRNRTMNGKNSENYDYNCDKCGHLYKNLWDSYSNISKDVDICPFCAKDIKKPTVSFKRKSPKRKSPKRKSPKRKSPKRKSPKRKSPKRKSPKRKSPKRKSPKRKSPKRKSPKRSKYSKKSRKNSVRK